MKQVNYVTVRCEDEVLVSIPAERAARCPRVFYFRGEWRSNYRSELVAMLDGAFYTR